MLVQSQPRGAQYAACLINLSRFDVIGLCYVLDRIMKRAPCIFFFLPSPVEEQSFVYLIIMLARV